MILFSNCDFCCWSPMYKKNTHGQTGRRIWPLSDPVEVKRTRRRQKNNNNNNNNTAYGETVFNTEITLSVESTRIWLSVCLVWTDCVFSLDVQSCLCGTLTEKAFVSSEHKYGKIWRIQPRFTMQEYVYVYNQISSTFDRNKKSSSWLKRTLGKMMKSMVNSSISDQTYFMLSSLRPFCSIWAVLRCFSFFCTVEKVRSCVFDIHALVTKGRSLQTIIPSIF